MSSNRSSYASSIAECEAVVEFSNCTARSTDPASAGVRWALDPGFEIDLLVTSSLKRMTSIWMGLTGVRSEIEAGRVLLDGDPPIARAMQAWLGLSTFAAERHGVS